jgi:uncharacterized protein YyaL (SSP411 family)
VAAPLCPAGAGVETTGIAVAGSIAGMVNKLAGETSPYLLQHAHNPVDWQPWGPLALAQAKLLDRPIFLSIGYAACHWCHVMERESFEDETIAGYLNEHFVSIKVDREERPDIDQVYMTAVQAMTGSGGWPMSVFLTPDGKPFYGGTYFPPEPHHGMPSFGQILQSVVHAWHDQREEVEQAGVRLVEGLVRANQLPAGERLPSIEDLDAAVATLQTQFDPANGGWSGAPKFPAPMTIEFLLRRARAGDPRALPMARVTLDQMAAGGVRDQLGGGFHRYATDAIWLVPHFELMLYDNAQLARAYLHAWALTGNEADRLVATGTLDAILRDFTTADGAFAASLDADTEGVEGGTFTWTADEVRRLLGDDAALFAAAYDVTDEGNWEERTILHRVRSTAELARAFGADEDAVESRLAAARARLLEARRQRPQPARDDKALAAWNGLAIAALAEAARLLGASEDPAVRARAEGYRAAAVGAAEAITAGLLDDRGRLRRSWKDGRASGYGVLEDYSDLADGLLALYEATFDERWFVAARGLVETVLAHFVDPDGGFFDTADDHESLVARPRDSQDNATPSGAAMAVHVLLRLGAWTGERRYRAAAETALTQLTPYLPRYPGAFAHWLAAADLQLSGIDELAIAGDPAEAATQSLLAPASRGYRPNQVLAAAGEPATSAIPLLEGRVAVEGRPTAYLCRDFACRLPVTDAAGLEALLGERAA